jgi:CheY-like chemotaxis protein
VRSTRVILLVHPQDENRATLQVMLRREGYTVIEAADVMGALEQIRESVPDLVVTAMRLPRSPGSELIRTIRSDTSYPWLKVLALGESGSQAQAEAAGADTFVVWPGKPERVVAEATRMLGRV